MVVLYSMNKLTQEEKRVIIDKGTEAPFTGEYDNFYKDGYYVCKQCDKKLFDSKSKFDAGCGWPAFDEFYKDAVKEILDADGRRTEIICNNCNGHLGHVFRGEGYTEKDTRHCVNSISLKFIDGNNKKG
jgi:peptide-methionine (R)-S-oxide reductase